MECLFPHYGIYKVDFNISYCQVEDIGHVTNLILQNFYHNCSNDFLNLEIKSTAGMATIAEKPKTTQTVTFL